jgi:hypothetical protein
VQDNYLRANIFFQTLNVNKMEETPKYDVGVQKSLLSFLCNKEQYCSNTGGNRVRLRWRSAESLPWRCRHLHL